MTHKCALMKGAECYFGALSAPPRCPPPYPRFGTKAIERMTAELDSGALTVVASPS